MNRYGLNRTCTLCVGEAVIVVERVKRLKRKEEVRRDIMPAPRGDELN